MMEMPRGIDKNTILIGTFYYSLLNHLIIYLVTYQTCPQNTLCRGAMLDAGDIVMSKIVMAPAPQSLVLGD